jgi:hypothetical protein
MKLALRLRLFLLLLVGTTLLTQKATSQVSVSLQVFYDDLSPYGNWVDNPDYGYVWIPQVPQGFSPYNTNGHWVFTEAGWTWVSDYSWGWAPFHYGRWYSDANYGWVWVPDTEWGPGWVSWRHSDSYYGWAPIGPGISIEIAYSSGYSVPSNHWNFVRNRDFGRRNLNNYYVNNSNNVTIINNTTVINNIQRDGRRNVSYNAGPDRAEVKQRTGTNFAPMVIRDRDKPGRPAGQKAVKNELQLYRPQVARTNNQGAAPVPTKVVAMKDVKPEAQRNKASNPTVFPQPTKGTKGQKVPQAQESQPTKGVPTRKAAGSPQAAPGRTAPAVKQNQPKGNKPAPSSPSPQQRNSQQAKEQQVQQQRNNQQAQQQQAQQQQNNKQAQQQQAQQQQNNKQAQQQQVQQRTNQQAQQQNNRQQQVRQQRNTQQAQQQQRNNQQQQRNNQQQQQQRQPNGNEPAKR